MKSVNKLAFTTGVALSLLAGDRAVQAYDVQPKPAHEVADARAASRAIAARYLECGITKVLDYDQAQAQPDAFPSDDQPRDKVVVEVKVRESAEATAARARYDQDDTVLWMPQEIMARKHREGAKGPYALGRGLPGSFRHEAVNADQIAQPFYPLASGEAGSYGVFIGQSAEVYDHEGGRKYSDYHAQYCGTIVFKAMSEGGEARWQLDPHAAPMDNVDVNRECELTPDPDQPNVSFATC